MRAGIAYSGGVERVRRAPRARSNAAFGARADKGLLPRRPARAAAEIIAAHGSATTPTTAAATGNASGVRPRRASANC